jgi:hypothetical protein
LSLKLESSAGAAARYQAELSSGDATWHGAVEIDAEGNVRLEPWVPAEPPAWLCQATSAMVRAAWRSEERGSRAQPRRITAGAPHLSLADGCYARGR